MDELDVIDRVLEEHNAVRQHIKLVGDSMSDQEAISSLQGARADWIPGRSDALAEKHKRLQRSLAALDEGLRNHFSFEEETLPPILGRTIMTALTIEHGEIGRHIAEATKLAAEIQPEGPGRQELLATESQIQAAISKICQLLEDHAEKEEVILGMAQKALRGAEGNG